MSVLTGAILCCIGERERARSVCISLCCRIFQVVNGVAMAHVC